MFWFHTSSWPTKANQHNQHQRSDSCYVSVKKIIQKISTPTASTGRTYKINDGDYKNLLLHLPDFRNKRLLYIVILLVPFAKCFISVNKYLIRKTKTWQYSYFSPHQVYSIWNSMVKNNLLSYSATSFFNRYITHGTFW